MVTFPDVDADPTVFYLWRLRASLQTLTYDGSRPEGLPAGGSVNSDQNAHLNQQSRHPGGPGGQSTGAIKRQSRLSHTPPSRATFKLTDQG